MFDPVTRLLAAREADNTVALDDLFPLVYAELRRVVGRHRRGERDALTMQTTELVHEVYLRLVDWKRVGWKGRAHFFALVGHVLRRLLVDEARRRGAGKRGGGIRPEALSDLDIPDDERADALLALDEALERLAQTDARLATVVECRFFSGMTMPEAAEALGVPLRTAERLWTRARAHLFVDLTASD